MNTQLVKQIFPEALRLTRTSTLSAISFCCEYCFKAIFCHSKTWVFFFFFFIKWKCQYIESSVCRNDVQQKRQMIILGICMGRGDNPKSFDHIEFRHVFWLDTDVLATSKFLTTVDVDFKHFGQNIRLSKISGKTVTSPACSVYISIPAKFPIQKYLWT